MEPTIEHVIVLVLENRSFDHMLGYLDHPDPDFDGLVGHHYTNPPWRGRGEPVPTSPAAKRVVPVDPDHSHDAAMEQLAPRGRGPTSHQSGLRQELRAQGPRPRPVDVRWACWARGTSAGRVTKTRSTVVVPS